MYNLYSDRHQKARQLLRRRFARLVLFAGVVIALWAAWTGMAEVRTINTAPKVKLEDNGGCIKAGNATNKSYSEVCPDK